MDFFRPSPLLLASQPPIQPLCLSSLYPILYKAARDIFPYMDSSAHEHSKAPCCPELKISVGWRRSTKDSRSPQDLSWPPSLWPQTSHLLAYKCRCRASKWGLSWSFYLNWQSYPDRFPPLTASRPLHPAHLGFFPALVFFTHLASAGLVHLTCLLSLSPPRTDLPQGKGFYPIFSFPCCDRSA